MFAIVVGPPLWWGLLCTCTLCTLDNPALNLTKDGRTDRQIDRQTDPIVAYTAVSIASYADAL